MLVHLVLMPIAQPSPMVDHSCDLRSVMTVDLQGTFELYAVCLDSVYEWLDGLVQVCDGLNATGRVNDGMSDTTFTRIVNA